jgi:hypothetical protein
MMDPKRRNDRKSFFKYTSASTAKLVLESKAFRWAAPTLFNDPFDHQTSFVLDESGAQLAASLSAYIRDLIYADDELPATSTVLGSMVKQLRAGRRDDRREELCGEIDEFCKRHAEAAQDRVDEFSAQITSFMQQFRVFCVSETNRNVVMWSHYASEHRGVAFELGCIPEIDNPLLLAQPVQYSKSFPKFPALEFYKSLMWGDPLELLPPLCWELPYLKHNDWGYEREWRVIMPLLDKPTGDDVSFFPENEAVFGAMYLGCKMTDPDAESLIALARHHLPRMKIVRAVKAARNFDLEFIEVSPN